MGHIVAIVGRPNVGKSTLFNRLTKQFDAIVDETSGVTRDRHYGKVEWDGFEFSIVDTGGYVTNSDDIFEEEIRKQVHYAINEADLILFMTDVKNGITDLDLQIAEMLRKINKKIFLVVNKVDNNTLQYEAAEFYKLGLGDCIPISSLNGSGTGDLLDKIVSELRTIKTKPLLVDDENLPKIAIVGRPNVGKSTLLNTLVGEERNIITPIPGTTRDAIHTRYRKFGYDFYLVDTAGIRKKSKIKDNIEFYSVLRSIKAIENSDVCLLMIDAQRGVESQDLTILNTIIKNKKGVLLLVNKWDLIEKDSNTAKQFEEKIRYKIAPFDDIPIIFISAIQKQRIYKVLEKALEVYENRKQKIPTSKLNEILLPIIEETPPPAVKGKYIKIKYITQLPLSYPAFAFFCNRPKLIRAPYKRFLENKIRENFNFSGIPIDIIFKEK